MLNAFYTKTFRLFQLAQMHKVYSSNANIIICMYGIFNASKRLCSFHDSAVPLEVSLGIYTNVSGPHEVSGLYVFNSSEHFEDTRHASRNVIA